MRGYSTMSDEERNSILQQHSAFYNGYATGNIPSGPQPLLQDEGPSDSQGITRNNRGEVGQCRNHLVHESVVSEQEGKGCAKSEGGSGGIKKKGDEWVIMNNKKGGVWNAGFTSEKDAEKALDAYHANVSEEVKEYAADDMDVSDVESAYDFESGGPEQFADEDSDFETELEFDKKGGSDDYDFSYSDESHNLDFDSIRDMFDGLQVYDDEYDGLEKYKGEIPAYQFDSEGAMDVDLYEEEQCEGCGGEMYEESQMCESCGGEMYEGECMECGGMYEDVDEDLRESFLKEKKKISEMFDRFKRFN